MRVQIMGFRAFKNAKKNDASIIYTGVYLYGITPIDSDNGKGFSTVTLTVWEDQITRLLPNGAEPLLQKKADIYFDRNQNLEVIQVVTA